jgi:hypothetical protein
MPSNRTITRAIRPWLLQGIVSRGLELPKIQLIDRRGLQRFMVLFFIGLWYKDEGGGR